MGDGIGGPVIGCLSNNIFELLVTHFRKDNKEDYAKTERIIIAKIDNPDEPQYKETTKTDLEMALKELRQAIGQESSRQNISRQ